MIFVKHVTKRVSTDPALDPGKADNPAFLRDVVL